MIHPALTEQDQVEGCDWSVNIFKNELPFPSDLKQAKEYNFESFSKVCFLLNPYISYQNRYLFISCVMNNYYFYINDKIDLFLGQEIIKYLKNILKVKISKTEHFSLVKSLLEIQTGTNTLGYFADELVSDRLWTEYATDQIVIVVHLRGNTSYFGYIILM